MLPEIMSDDATRRTKSTRWTNQTNGGLYEVDSKELKLRWPVTRLDGNVESKELKGEGRGSLEFDSTSQEAAQGAE